MFSCPASTYRLDGASGSVVGRLSSAITLRTHQHQFLSAITQHFSQYSTYRYRYFTLIGPSDEERAGFCDTHTDSGKNRNDYIDPYVTHMGQKVYTHTLELSCIHRRRRGKANM